MNWIIKFFLAGGLITGANALMRLSPKLSASLIALPTSSIIYFLFLWNDSKDKTLLANASWDIFRIVIPSLLFFPLFSLALTKWNLNFPLGLSLAIVACVLVYVIQTKLGWG